jgi:hypothetical protein
MRRSLITMGAAVIAAVAAGCASYPAPVGHLAAAQAAAQSAQDVGAESTSDGQLHLKMAQQEIALARRLLNAGDNERADFILLRARADAELASAEAEAAKAHSQAQASVAQVAELRAEAEAKKAAVPASVTTLTAPPAATTTTAMEGRP